MAETRPIGPGEFCWAELRTTDAAAAKDLYSDIFGWSLEDVLMGDAGTYTLCRKDGKDVAGLYEMQGQQRAETPPHWSAYFSVRSADDMARRAKKLGGTILAEPFDVMDVGRMAVIQDPTGPFFSLWETKQRGDLVVRTHGALSWAEVGTHDTETAGRFYSELFGWDRAETDMGDDVEKYTVFRHGGEDRAGMYELGPRQGDAPPHWLVYFRVADCEAALDTAGRKGGKVLMPATPIPQGRFAVILDPQRAIFGIFEALPES